jgi:predicted nuclease of predicted toxin-antitoxin system
MIFYFDENLNKKVAEALDILDMDNTIKSVKNEFEGKLDLDLIPLLAKEEAILITFDKKMRRLQSERKSLENNKMIVFFLASYPTGWDFVKLIIKS